MNSSISRPMIFQPSDMTIQRESFVLRENVNAAQIGVDAVGEGDVNNAIDPAEGNGRVRAVARERTQPLAASSRQQKPQSIFHGAPASMLVAAPGRQPPAGDSTAPRPA